MIYALLLAFQDTQTSEFRTAYETAFRSTFRAKFTESCVASAKKTAARGIDPTPMCTCTTERLLATRSVEQLSTPLPPDELRPLVAECVRKHLPKSK